MTISLGIDPGLANSGFGVIRRGGRRIEWLEAGTITTDSARPLLERQLHVWKTVVGLIRDHHPQVMCIEDQSGVSAGARMAMKRAIDAARRGVDVKAFGFNASNDGVTEVVGVLKAAAFAYGVPVVMLQPRTIKVQLIGPGGGKAEKGEIKAAIARLFPDIGRLSSHGADGLAIAIGGERVWRLESARVG